MKRGQSLAAAAHVRAEIRRLLASGVGRNEVARRLGCSRRTVDAVRRTIAEEGQAVALTAEAYAAARALATLPEDSERDGLVSVLGAVADVFEACAVAARRRSWSPNRRPSRPGLRRAHAAHDLACDKLFRNG